MMGKGVEGILGMPCEEGLRGIVRDEMSDRSQINAISYVYAAHLCPVC